MSELLIVSNRLPVTARLEHGRVRVARSVGGLATGLRSLHEKAGSVWLGWPGDVSELDATQRLELNRLLTERRVVPVYLTAHQVRSFYEGFSNSVLWPLLHYQLDRVRHDATEEWQLYQEVNELFAEAAARSVADGGTVWIHDFQLLLVPGMLRRRRPNLRIGFFLHIPFPSAEVFRTLPWRREVLQGLLGADLIGFHTHSYVRNFSMALRYVLGADMDFNRLRYEGREVRLGAFPMGIDAAGFSEMANEPSVAAEAAEIRRERGGRKLLVAIDRLDYTKGIKRRLLAIERLLEREPAWRGNLRLVQVAVPSRTGVESYRQFRKEIDEMVGRINGTYSTVDSVPIHYMYRSLSRQQVVALYRAADVMLVTPLRDGMNLVAKEFCAARPDEDGVLVLSEFAGAAVELGEAIQVNPYDIEGAASAIELALSLPPEERKARMRALRRRIARADVHHWARSFLEALPKQGPVPALPAPSGPQQLDSVVARIAEVPRVLLLLDYDGTLVPFARVPELATADVELLELLGELAALPGVSVHVVSGRPRDSLERWLGHLPIGLHAEHAYWARLEPQAAWIACAEEPPEWKSRVGPIFESFVATTPGSLIEEKTVSLAWHYRMADPEFGGFQAMELRRVLDELLRNTPMEVLLGDRVVEVRLRAARKSLALQTLASNGAAPLILAMGDDRTDEDLFAALPPGGIAIHVSESKPTQAPYRLTGPANARQFLRQVLERRAAAALDAAGLEPSR